MILINGVFSYACSDADSEFDTHGNPVPRPLAWSEPLPCFIYLSSDDRKAQYQDGEFRKVAMTIYTEKAVPLNACFIRATRSGDDLGEFSVIRIEPQEYACFTKIYA